MTILTILLFVSYLTFAQNTKRNRLYFNLDRAFISAYQFGFEHQFKNRHHAVMLDGGLIISYRNVSNFRMSYPKALNGFVIKPQYRYYFSGNEILYINRKKTNYIDLYVSPFFRYEKINNNYLYEEYIWDEDNWTYTVEKHIIKDKLEIIEGGVMAGLLIAFGDKFFIDPSLGFGYKDVNEKSQNPYDPWMWRPGFRSFLYSRNYSGFVPRISVKIGISI
jgi:hypothetical protein